MRNKKGANKKNYIKLKMKKKNSNQRKNKNMNVLLKRHIVLFIIFRHPVSICEFGCKHSEAGCTVQDERPCVFTYIHNTCIPRNEVIKFKNRGAHIKWAAFGLPPLNYASGRTVRRRFGKESQTQGRLNVTKMMEIRNRVTSVFLKDSYDLLLKKILARFK